MLANIITLLRLALVPLILWLATVRDPRLITVGMGLFVLAALTDWLDGFLARHWGQITPFGTLMDPLVDKTLMLGLLIVFAHMGLFPLWIALVNLFREMLVSGIRRVKALEGKLEGANWMGKTKFVLQTLLVGGIYVWLAFRRPEELPEENAFIYAAALLVTAVSVIFAANFLRWNAEGLFRPRSGSEG